MKNTQVVYVIINQTAGIPFYVFENEDKARQKLQECVSGSSDDYSLELSYFIK